jgi:hypothetical protein
MYKSCKICKLEKDISNFRLSGKYHSSYCFDCERQKNRDYRAKHKEKYSAYNKQYMETYNKEYYKVNKTALIAYQKEYKETNPDKVKQRQQNYYINNKDKIKQQVRKYTDNKRLNDPIFRLKESISSNIRICIKKNNQPFSKYLPYTIQELKAHLEKQFEPWMTWDNYGTYRIDTWNDNDDGTWFWQIDHIIPHSTFQYSSMEDDEFRKCWALENLRPYSAKQNVIDGKFRQITSQKP